MKAIDILHKDNAGIEWAVMSRNGWASKEQKSAGKVDRKHCVKVTLVDTKKYNKTHHVQQVNSSSFFVEAPKGERSTGFLVTDGSVFWVCPSADFIDSWQRMEGFWAIAEKVEAERQAQCDRRAGKEAKVTATLYADKAVLTDNVRKSTEAILGSTSSLKIYISPQIMWVNDTPTGVLNGEVTLSVGDYQRLLEKLYEAREANN